MSYSLSSRRDVGFWEEETAEPDLYVVEIVKPRDSVQL